MLFCTHLGTEAHHFITEIQLINVHHLPERKAQMVILVSEHQHSKQITQFSNILRKMNSPTAVTDNLALCYHILQTDMIMYFFPHLVQNVSLYVCMYDFNDIM